MLKPFNRGHSFHRIDPIKDISIKVCGIAVQITFSPDH